MALSRTNFKYKALTLIGLLLFSVFAYTPVFSQSIGNEVQVLMSPTYPGPYEDITMSVQSFAFDINRSRIAWYVDGDKRLEGVGEVIASITAGPVGSVTQIRIVIEPPTGRGQVVKNIVIRPAEVTIVWEAVSYTPPFYKGKALSPSAGFVKVTAIPNLITSGGVKIPANELVYTWKEKGVTLGNSSGYGKQSVFLSNGSVPHAPLTVSVTVSSFNNTVSAEKSVQIPVTGTKVLFYEKNPLQGLLYNKSIRSGYVFKSKEVSIRGEPMFFSLDDISNNYLTYRWKINNSDITIPIGEQTREMTFRVEEATAGSAQLSLDIFNENLPFRVLQDANSTVSVVLKP